MRKARVIFATFAVSAALSGPAAAARAQSFGATATTKKPIAATNDEDASASGSAIDVRERKRALEDIADALVELPGLRVTSTGGAGAPALVSLRGAELAHTTVMLDAIPLNTADSGAFDLSTMPLSSLDRIEVYRGGAPVWYGDGAIGGVVRFVPASAEGSELQATAGLGSFGRRELRATGAISAGTAAQPNWLGHVRLLAADNDYEYVDDGRTRFDSLDMPASADDRMQRQRNGDTTQGDGLMHLGLDALGGRVAVVLAGHGRLEGIPGPLAQRTLQVRRKLVRTLAGVSYQREGHDAPGDRSYRVQLVASGSHQHSSLTDLETELGISKHVDSDDIWQRTYFRAAGSLRVLPFLEPSLVASLALDDYAPENHAAFGAPPQSSSRSTQAIAFEPRMLGELLGMPVELRPSMRFEYSQTHIWAQQGAGEIIDERDQDVRPTYRLAGVIGLWPALSLSSSVSTGSRLPSISELFGDRVYQDPNPTLKPERSTSADVGVVVQGRAGELRGSLEARGFSLWIEDLIRFERTSQYTVRPDNIASAEILGLEVGATGRYGRHLSLAGSLTTMHTETVFGTALPLRPPLQALVRPAVAFFPSPLDEVSLFTELQHVSFVYLGDDNRAHLPGRTFVSAGGSLAFWRSRVLVELRAINLLDARASDVLSRPLPGRDIRISITLREQLDGP